ncbi:hypothetical protein N5D37_11370 [Comamonas aquatica]|uniref:hypothetical protein n=1 Tax=Comamonas aquatica TaxID=225991 RepID=UPI00244CA5E8|nr:hypothetical protein [Comamonas aquatica]MDH1766249.1 hypothetical protein [Comamonas aquatica]
MSYFTGSANSYEELRDAIKAACVLKGWTDQGGGLVSHGGLYVNLQHNANGVLAYVGTGITAGALTGGVAGSGARLGKISPGSRFPVVTWPATYHLFIHENPDEVYVVLNFNVDHHYWMCFGASDIPGLGGSGNWYAGCAVPTYSWGSYGDSQHSYSMTESTGANGYSGGSGPWWHTSFFSDGLGAGAAGHGIHVGIDGIEWTSLLGSSAVGFCTAQRFLNGLPQGPNPWNGEAVLHPISVFMARASSKVSLVLQKRHARYVRIDNYEPGQLITLGHEQWKVFPFAKKNATSRNSTPSDSGTFGWAIRYVVDEV